MAAIEHETGRGGADDQAQRERIANLGIGDWSLWSGPGQPGLRERLAAGWRAAVFDAGGFEDPAEAGPVSPGVLDTLWRHREERQPTPIVIDEADNVCPAAPTDPIQQAATERAIQISGEGRKFGLYLLLATQRPQKLHPNVLSQDDNLIVMRMNPAADLATLRETFSFVPAAMLDQAARFAQGEVLLAGRIVPSPLFARVTGRRSPEGGGDLPATWVRRG